ncbi:MAG: tRNA preQ1(34) S-adenosylmethionine ribosyltransferase-isomerase QueA [Thermodesulfovibrionales bacterium]|jgi:S-adenosylmethionine:tRNA ribosyltransferase-isomerase
MKTADFQFHLPKELIALRPSEKRDHSRLLVLHRDGSVEHWQFFEIPRYLREGDMIIVNNTKVFPARIMGAKPTGGKLDLLLIREADGLSTWEVLCRGSYAGLISLPGGVKAEVWSEGTGTAEEPPKRFLKFLDVEREAILDLLWDCGGMPLPPYIGRLPDEEDKQRYQTVYAEHQGSVAAPTAGLHFTEALIREIEEKGVLVRRLTHHVGPGTFKPIRAESLSDHRMDREEFEIPVSLLQEIREVKAGGNRVITVGTTTTRAMEGVMSERWSGTRENGLIRGDTDIFIYPGYKFRVSDGLITNFHLPSSTPLMLTSAFCGFEKVMKAYQEAIALGYRFFSYGDAMLILE